MFVDSHCHLDFPDFAADMPAVLDAMAAALIKYETIDENQIKDIMAGRAPKPPADWDDSVGTPPPKRTDGEPEGGPTIGSPAGQH